MRVGIDAHVLGKDIGGVERYVQKVVELVPDLSPQHQFTVFLSRHAKDRFKADGRPNVRFVTLPVSDPIIQRSVLMPLAVRRFRLDVLHVQRIAPWGCGRCRILLAVHDLIPVKQPAAYPGLRDRLVRLLTPGSIARADLIVCPTRWVCGDIERRYPGTGARTRAFYNGVDTQRFHRREQQSAKVSLAPYGIDGPYMFSSGGVEARRNIETVIDALARLDAASRPQLVLSGHVRDPACLARLQQLASERGVAERIRYLGFVPEADLVALYTNAMACIAASTDEGFNLLPLEALACGRPVICSDIPVHRELYDGAVSFFPPDRPDLLADRIRQHAAPNYDQAAGLDAASRCVARLSWQAMAQRMASFIDELSHNGGTHLPLRA